MEYRNTLEPVDPELFYRRLQLFVARWKEVCQQPGTQALQSSGGILLGEAHAYTKTQAVVVFLCGRPLADTLVLISDCHSVVFLCPQAEAARLSSLPEYHHHQIRLAPNPLPHVQIIVKPAHPLPAAAAAMHSFLASLHQLVARTGRKIGCLREGEPIEEEFMHEWVDFLDANGSSGLLSKAPNLAAAISRILAAKDAQEIERIRIACHLSNTLMALVRAQILLLIKTDIKNGSIHKELRTILQRKHDQGSIWDGAKYAPDVDHSFGYNQCYYSPTIQAGNKWVGQRPPVPVGPGHDRTSEIILVQLGNQYKSYNSDVSRTFMIEPHPNQEANYEYLVELHKFAIGIIKEGVVASDVYDAIKRKVAAERAELAPCLPRSFGTSLGVEFGDAFLGIKPSCAGVLARNSVFSLALSFAKVPLEDASSSPTRPRGWYSLKITDTILVGQERSTVLSDLPRDRADVSFCRDDDGGGAPETEGREDEPVPDRPRRVAEDSGMAGGPEKKRAAPREPSAGRAAAKRMRRCPAAAMADGRTTVHEGDGPSSPPPSLPTSPLLSTPIAHSLHTQIRPPSLLAHVARLFKTLWRPSRS